MVIDAKRQGCDSFFQMVVVGPNYNQVAEDCLKDALLGCVTWCCSIRHKNRPLLLCPPLPMFSTIADWMELAPAEPSVVGHTCNLSYQRGQQQGHVPMITWAVKTVSQVRSMRQR